MGLQIAARFEPVVPRAILREAGFRSFIFHATGQSDVVLTFVDVDDLEVEVTRQPAPRFEVCRVSGATADQTRRTSALPHRNDRYRALANVRSWPTPTFPQHPIVSSIGPNQHRIRHPVSRDRGPNEGAIAARDAVRDRELTLFCCIAGVDCGSGEQPRRCRWSCIESSSAIIDDLRSAKSPRTPSQLCQPLHEHPGLIVLLPPTID